MRASLFALLLVLILDPSPAAACTSFCMDTPEGPLYGTNLDLFQPGDGLVCVNRRGIAKEGYFHNIDGEPLRWESRFGSLSFNLAGRELVWGGMNEAGLVMSSMQLDASKCPREDERYPMGAGILVQYLLDTCASVEEAIAAVKIIRPPESECDNHFLVVDGDGNGVAIEWLDRELRIYSGDTLPYRAMANMPYDKARQAYDRGGPRWWWSNPGASAQRVAGCVDRARAYDPNQHADAVSYAFETLGLVRAGHTRWNIVFDLNQRKIWYRTERSPTIKTLRMDAFDYSCDAPLLVLDVNADLEGDVSGEFQPYDRAVNKELFQVFVARWGIEVSEEDATALMDLFEDYECAQSQAPEAN